MFCQSFEIWFFYMRNLISVVQMVSCDYTRVDMVVSKQGGQHFTQLLIIHHINILLIIFHRNIYCLVYSWIHHCWDIELWFLIQHGCTQMLETGGMTLLGNRHVLEVVRGQYHFVIDGSFDENAICTVSITDIWRVTKQRKIVDPVPNPNLTWFYRLCVCIRHHHLDH